MTAPQHNIPPEPIAVMEAIRKRHRMGVYSLVRGAQ
jgi:hypothetical protein